MSRKVIKNSLLVTSMILGVLGLQGCATLDQGPPEQVVTQKANQRWKALVAENWTQAYGALVPSYRSVHSVDDFRKSFAMSVRWVDGEVVSAACEEAKCTLRVKVTTLLPFARRPGETISTHVDETWLLESGNWYYYQAP